jgi:hypothetical protein
MILNNPPNSFLEFKQICCDNTQAPCDVADTPLIFFPDDLVKFQVFTDNTNLKIGLCDQCMMTVGEIGTISYQQCNECGVPSANIEMIIPYFLNAGQCYTFCIYEEIDACLTAQFLAVDEFNNYTIVQGTMYSYLGNFYWAYQSGTYNIITTPPNANGAMAQSFCPYMVPIPLYCTAHWIFKHPPPDSSCHTRMVRYRSEGCGDLLGFDYKNQTFYNQIRLPMALHSPQNKGDSTVFTKSDGKTIKLSEILVKEYELETEFITERQHDCMAIMLAHDIFDIWDEKKGAWVGYIKEVNVKYNAKWTAKPLKYPYAQGECKLILSDYQRVNRACGFIDCEPIILPPCVFNLSLTDDADFLTLISEMDVEPDVYHKKVIRSTIARLKTAGLWDKLERLYLLPAHHRQAATVCWKNPNLTNRLLEVGWGGNDYHTIDVGNITAPANAFYNTQFSPIDGFIYTQDSAFFLKFSKAQTGIIMGCADPTPDIALNIYQDSSSFAEINGTQFYAYNNTLFKSISRNGDAITVFDFGVLVTSVSQSSVGRTNLPVYINAFNFGGTPYDDMPLDEWYIFACGAGLDETEQANLYDILRCYCIAINSDYFTPILPELP